MKIKHKNKYINLPDCIIAGAAKSGTTALFKYLSEYNEIYCSEIKEPWFFSHMNNENKYINPITNEDLSRHIINNLNDYSSLFTNANEKQIAIEASTSYLYNSSEVISNIKKTYGDKYKNLKIILILRNPVDRAWSHYNMHVRENMHDDLSFKKSIDKTVIQNRLKKGWGSGFDYIRLGCYYKDVKNFIEVFPNIKIFIYDDFISEPSIVINEIKNFLDIHDNRLPDFSKKYNVSGLPKNIISQFLAYLIYKPNIIKYFIKFVFSRKIRYQFKMYLGQKLFSKKEMDNRCKQELLKFFKNDILALSKLLHKDLSIWDETIPQ